MANPKNPRITNKSLPPIISNHVARNVSQYRRAALEEEINQGIYRDGSGPVPRDEDPNQSRGYATYSVGRGPMSKYANLASTLGTNTSNQWQGGSGDTLRQAPEVYSPLWLNSNLNLPRDRATINAWCRSFYALNPFVNNAINLHSTYPISKLTIRCPDKRVEKFFNEMIDEVDLMNICVQIAQEFWLLGEAFVYAELDERNLRWSRLRIQNPDYVVVSPSVISSEPIIMLRPDANLRRIVFSQKPSDLEQKKQLGPHIVEYVKRGQNIPLDNFYVSHLARRISPYETRGTGLPVAFFRQLMLFDKLRECYSTDCEVLTDQGFKTIDQLVELSTDTNPNSNYVNGIVLGSDGKPASILKMKEDFKVACVNPDTNEIEYHKPTELHMSHYEGKMLHFAGKKIDTLVTPNHKMWVNEQTNGKWGNFQKRPASELLLKKKYYKFSSKAKYVTGKSTETIDILGHQVPTDLYMKVLGYVVSEGCVYENYEKDRYDAKICLNQLTSSDCYMDMRRSLETFANLLGKKCCSYVNVKGSGYSKDHAKEKWEAFVHGKDLTQYLKKEIGTNGSTLSADKHLPRWVLNLKPDYLKILLNSLVKGDGSESESKYGTKSKSYKYSTISKQLADDVYELVYKCGSVPNICVSNATKSDGRVVTEYIVMWSSTDYGNEPLVYTGKKSRDNVGGGATINEVDYNGTVWCFEVPTGLFITRKNGKITILGNSKFAQADNMINPLTLVKVGSADFKPTPAQIDTFREIFECHDEETEVLTRDGFRKFNEVIDYDESVTLARNNVGTKFLARPKPGVEVACFNSANEQLEYHVPSAAHVSDYSGEMYHFKNNKIDLKVTPNHKLWLSERRYEYHGHRSLRKAKWSDWKKIEAKDIKLTDQNKFRSKINWVGKEVRDTDVAGKKVPIELYLEFLGYLLSEGCLYTGHESQFKRIPTWVKELNPRLLTILLQALVKGDGSVHKRKDPNKNGFSYYSTSKQLADDVYEIVYKCGFVPTMFVRRDQKYIDDRRLPLYTVMWSNCGKGEFPSVSKTSRNSVTKEKHDTFVKEQYDGKVWCLTVPTGLFVTRRNGKITIQGNSAQYDKDFKIFTHEAVTVERIGAGQGIYDISGDITQLIKEIWIGLMVPSVLMDGGQDTTYANGGVALDVLRQRYMQFRNMLSTWLRHKIFAPISKLNEFYVFHEKQKHLIIPEIDWNHMSLFDAGDYIQNLIHLSDDPKNKRVSTQTLYRSLGLEFEEEVRKMRKEDVQDAIRKKEQVSLQKMPLNELRTLGDDDEIPETAEAPLPGETGGGDEGGGDLPGAGGGGGMPDLGAPPGAPPGPEAGPPGAPPPPPK